MSDDKENARSGFESRERKRNIEVKSEPRTYGPDSEFSYFYDLARSVTHSPETSAAKERLARHARENEVEAESRSASGLRARRAMNERLRGETRALTSASTSAGAFVTPEYLIADWAAYRTPEKSFTNQTTNLPIPDYGLTVNIPSWTGSASVAQQTEGSAVVETDPTGASVSATLVPLVGQITVSQQEWDRAGAAGTSTDQFIIGQLTYQLNTAIDNYVLTQALSNAASVTDTAAFTASVFYNDIAKAREQLTDTNGVRLNPTHVFSTSDFFAYVSRQVDSSLRPLLVPDSNALVSAKGDPDWASFTGVHLPGALAWFQDDNIPASGSNTQIIVARPQEVYTFDGEHTAYAYPETLANKLQVVVGIKAYVGVIVRFPKAIAVINGSTYPTTLN